MTSAVWTLLIILAKVGIFAGIIASAGGIAALRGYHNGSRASHARLLSYCLLGALLGFHSSLAPVLIQAGQINDAGLLGMFDIDLVLFLRGTPVWESAAYRGVGFALSALLVLALQKTLNAQRKSPEPVFYHIASFGQALALALRIYSVRSHLAARPMGTGSADHSCCGNEHLARHASPFTLVLCRYANGPADQANDPFQPLRYWFSCYSRFHRDHYVALLDRCCGSIHNKLWAPYAAQISGLYCRAPLCST